MKAAASIAKQNRDERCLRVDDCDVGVAVVVEIGDGEIVGGRAAGERRTRRGVDSAAAIVQQNAHGAVIQVGNDEIGTRIVVEIGRREYARVRYGTQNGFVQRCGGAAGHQDARN